MAKDAELERLKIERDQAFQRKQDAYQAQQHAWEKRSSTRDTMLLAYKTRQQAYDKQARTQQRHQHAHSANGPRISLLNSQRDQAFQNTKRAFDNASSARDRHDDAGAASYVADGRRYKAEAQSYVAKRRRLVREIQSARDAYDSAKAVLLQAKSKFDRCKCAFEVARAEHEQAAAKFQQAKANFSSCTMAFRSRLEEVRTEDRKQHSDTASRAGVPPQYHDNAQASIDRRGNTNIYFGGSGKPDGPGHGHYVIDRNGKVTYARNPYDPHGAQNFTCNQRRDED